jgi:FHA domain
MDARTAQNLKPAELLSLMRAHGRAGFAKEVDAPLLLVRIDDGQGDLGLALVAALEDGSTSAGWRPEASLGYDTVVGSARDILSSRPPPLSGPLSFGGAAVHRRLFRALHFAVTLRKRRGASNVFSERISIGRARTNDIVLRHHSVSKFHAWFEQDEDDAFYMSAAKSTNPTLVNGADIAGSSLLRVHPGDEICFGTVVALFCPPEILWDALMVSGPPSSSKGRAG